ncbi:MAG: ribulokinase [Propionibacteriaceae bacterium]|jgi:L-ribulokinase|nr:ribulokinase [Propionibacteriaceae bacterium]
MTQPSALFDRRCVVGVDFGTLSGRAVVVRVSDGAELGSATSDYASGVIDRRLPGPGIELPPDWALQDPADYVTVLQTAVPAALAQAGVDPADVIGLGTDFTACTLIPCRADGLPLSQTPAWASRPHAWTKLWKHHAAQGQADRFNALARERGESWLARYGGLVSSEWEWAKGLQVLEEDPAVYAAADCFVEAADWIVWQLTGQRSRNACTAGYKGCYQDGAYPSPAFAAALNPGLAGFADKIAWPISPLGGLAGRLRPAAAAWTGLAAGTAVAVGNVDAHVAAAACQSVDPGQLVAIMGTSTCHIVNGRDLRAVPGMCGAVDGGVVAGLWGYEAGQSGVGDILGWFVDNCVPAAYAAEAGRLGVSVHALLSELAGQQAVGQHGLLALDWHSGNRSVLVDHQLSGLIIGQTLASRPEDSYRALVEATAFGTRVIVEAFRNAGVPVDRFTATGGLLKNPVLMQIYADVLDLPISVSASANGPALGSAIHAAAAAGAYPDVRTAASAMGRVEPDRWRPLPAEAAAYQSLFADYSELHDYFGRGGNQVMRRLKARRRQASSAG